MHEGSAISSADTRNGNDEEERRGYVGDEGSDLKVTCVDYSTVASQSDRVELIVYSDNGTSTRV